MYFRRASTDLCNALAHFGRRICTTYVDHLGLAAFTSCRLIALDKCPGVRPIGIGELACCILGKAILAIVSGDIQEIAGALQLCAGQKAGCDVAVHAMRQIFEDTNTQDVLFVDASNAFNNLNRKTALLNINLNYPSIAKLLIGLTPSFLLMGRLSFPRKEPLRGIPSPWLCMPSALATHSTP